METTEKTVDFIDTRWNLARIFALAALLLTFILLAITLPDRLMFIGIFVSGLGTLFGGWSLVRGGRMWARGALIVGAFLFSLSLTLHLAVGTILEALPTLLLAYVMILFSVEALDLIGTHAPAHSDEMYALLVTRANPAVQESLEHMFRKFARLALLFGACYIFAIGAVSAGDLFVSVSPLLSDVSIYIVAVSVSLALLLILRED
jgi:hypothetical protein